MTQPLPRQVTILGLGLFGGGAGAARYFAERGARVIVSDARPAEALTESIASLAGLSIEYHLGSHDASHVAGSEVVIVNPGVPDESPAIELARQAGARLDTEINLFLRLCPAPVAAVTGTNGKSTTVALLGEMLRATGRRAWMGGNLGGSLLPLVDTMRPEDVVALELSSFQTQRLAWTRISPHVAVALNLTPNHLDRHRDMEDYASAKQEILRWQGPQDMAVLNAADPIVRGWMEMGAGMKFLFGAEATAPRGARLEGNRLRLWREGEALDVSLQDLRIPGAHNLFNASCAAMAAWLMGADRAAIERGAREFCGLPDRIEFVAEKGGVRYYNDSIATTPEAAEVALESFREPIVLIAGGSSKNLSFDSLGRAIVRRAKTVVLTGRTAPEIEAAIRAAGGALPPIHHAATFAGAVALASRCAAPGDVVLLSPACASFDQFRNYAERGRVFKELVTQNAECRVQNAE